MLVNFISILEHCEVFKCTHMIFDFNILVNFLEKFGHLALGDICELGPDEFR